MHDYNHYLQMVNDAIARIQYPAKPERLYAPIAYTMALGGKRLRPVLTLMACEAMGGDPHQALDAAVGIELFHNFTLLHDDVMDRADVRRGQPTVHRRWNDNVAILSGDAMLTMATAILSKSDPQVMPQLLNLFNATAMEIYEGQQWDMDFEERDNVAEDEYLEMICLKTSVLLGCACQAGAIVARAMPQDADAIYAMAVSLGIAFQLQDDHLDVWGDPDTFGKAIGGDILNNKKTFLLINALQRASGTDADELAHWLRQPPSQDKIAAVTAIYEHLGLKELSREKIDHYTRAALRWLEKVDMSDDGRQAFTTLIHRLVSREK